jgi:hypothetical protein
MKLKPLQSVFLFLALLLGSAVVCTASEKGFTDLAIDTDGFASSELLTDPNSSDEEGQTEESDTYPALQSLEEISLHFEAGTASSQYGLQRHNSARQAHGIRAPPHALLFS